MQTFLNLPKSARFFVGGVVVAGLAAVLYAAIELHSSGVSNRLLILAALTLLSGSITVKVPSVPATISVSETFVFTAVLLFGPPAGTITVALDGLVISLWLRRRFKESYRAAFNVAAPALSIWISSQVFFAIAGVQPLSVSRTVAIPPLIVPLGVFTALYFLLNSWLIAVAIALEQGVSAVRVWRENFFWLGLNYFGGASVAALLVAYTRDLDWTSVGVIIPLLVISYLTYKTAMGRLEDTTRHLSQLNLLYLSTIETLARAIDARDQVTHNHIRRVQVFAVHLAKRIGVTDDSLIRAIEAAALLHDLGKLRVPEHILNKPGRLTQSEFERIKTHSRVGADILSSIEFPYPVVPIVRHHHENWDGSGYPDGLSGTNIPIGARVLAVVDCYDALTSDRPYRAALPEAEALAILVQRRGTMYDPVVVDAFLAIRTDLELSSVNGDRGIGEDAADVGVPLVHAPSSPRAAVMGRNHSPAPETGNLFRNLAGERSRKLQLMLADLAGTVPAAAALLYVQRTPDDDLRLLIAVGASIETASRIVETAPRAVVSWVAENQLPIVNAAASLDLGPITREFEPELGWCSGCPLRVDDGVVGVLMVYRPVGQPFDSVVHESLTTAAARIAAEWSTGGTGVTIPASTHRPEELRSQDDGRGQLAVILVASPTVDAPTGTDITVSAITETVQRALRPHDVVLRLGTGEVVALLPGLDRDAATSLATRIRCEIGYQSTVSIAMRPDDASSLDRLLEIARRSSHRDIRNPSHLPDSRVH